MERGVEGLSDEPVDTEEETVCVCVCERGRGE